MDDAERMSAMVAHARRDADSGNPWRCVCDICRYARKSPELVSQVQASLQKSSGLKKPAGKDQPA
jgi:hypothetical protein